EGMLLDEADDYVQKPVQLSSLLRRVERLLQRNEHEIGLVIANNCSTDSCGKPLPLAQPKPVG
ncbi:hypothetical protein ACFLXE_08950, partial [Chloroflexota bacterium]